MLEWQFQVCSYCVPILFWLCSWFDPIHTLFQYCSNFVILCSSSVPTKVSDKIGMHTLFQDCSPWISATRGKEAVFIICSYSKLHTTRLSWYATPTLFRLRSNIVHPYTEAIVDVTQEIDQYGKKLWLGTNHEQSQNNIVKQSEQTLNFNSNTVPDRHPPGAPWLACLFFLELLQTMQHQHRLASGSRIAINKLFIAIRN